MSPPQKKQSVPSPNGSRNLQGAEGNTSSGSLPEATIEAIARSLVREGQKYGFQQVDYLRLVNHLLDLAGQDAERVRPPARGPDLPGCVTPAELPLTGEQICIRAFDAATDKARLARWLEDAHGRFFLLSSITARSLDIDDVLRGDQNLLGIITLPDGTPIGTMAFLDWDRWQRKAELRKLIGEPHYRGRGFARQATALWIHYGLHGLGLKKIYLNTLQTNIRNIRLNEALGFRVEGILRREFLLDGEHHDLLRMALVNE